MNFNSVGHGGTADRVYFFIWFWLLVEIFFISVKFGDIGVGGVFIVFGDKKSAFAVFGLDLKFVAVLAANVAVIGFDFNSWKSEPGENFGIGLPHPLINLFKFFLVSVKRIRVFHHKFPDPKQTAAGAFLVAEFGGKLVNIKRQIAVTQFKVADQIHKHFFGGAA